MFPMVCRRYAPNAARAGRGQAEAHGAGTLLNYHPVRVLYNHEGANVHSAAPEQVEDVLETLAKEAARSLPEYCQKRALIYQLKRSLLHRVGASGITPSNVVHYFRESIDWLNNLQSTTNPLVGSPDNAASIRLKNALRKEKSDIAEHPEHYVWLRLDFTRAITEPESKHALWRVDMDGVSNCVNRYLNARWSNVPILERLMAETLAYAEALTFLEDSKGIWSLFPAIVQRFWQFAKSVLWLGAILYVASGAMERFGLWAAILSGGGMYWLVEHLHLNARVSNAKKARLLEEMISVYQIMGHQPGCPALLRERVIATSNLGVVWPAGMPNLIERAFRRNPEQWD